LATALSEECKKQKAITKAQRNRKRQEDIAQAILAAEARGVHPSRRILISIMKEKGKVADQLLIAVMLREKTSITTSSKPELH
jgi:5-deoxy-D-glucuronate isomerase